VRATAPLAALDDAVNDVHDRLNRAVPWLWAPLDVPQSDRPLGRAEHALYAAHSAAAVALAVAFGRPRAALVLTGAAIASWAVFTGAWNRRAGQAASAARRAR
jgi:hypothetical protein